MPSLLYANDLVLCSESEEDLRMIVEQFAGENKKRLKITAGKSKTMVLHGKEGL